jgi:hypothetical protein
VDIVSDVTAWPLPARRSDTRPPYPGQEPLPNVASSAWAFFPGLVLTRPSPGRARPEGGVRDVGFSSGAPSGLRPGRLGPDLPSGVPSGSSQWRPYSGPPGRRSLRPADSRLRRPARRSDARAIINNTISYSMSAVSHISAFRAP